MKQVVFAALLFMAVVSPGLSAHRIFIWNDTPNSAKFSIKYSGFTKFGKFISNVLAKESLDKKEGLNGSFTFNRSLVLDPGEQGSFNENIAIIKLTYPQGKPKDKTKGKIFFKDDANKIDKSNKWYRFYKNALGELTLCEVLESNYNNKKGKCAIY